MENDNGVTAQRTALSLATSSRSEVQSGMITILAREYLDRIAEALRPFPKRIDDTKGLLIISPDHYWQRTNERLREEREEIAAMVEAINAPWAVGLASAIRSRSLPAAAVEQPCCEDVNPNNPLISEGRKE